MGRGIVGRLAVPVFLKVSFLGGGMRLYHSRDACYATHTYTFVRVRIHNGQ